MGFVKALGKAVKNQITPGESLKQQWAQYRTECKAMEEYERDQSRKHAPGECTLFCYWWSTLFALIELLPRILWHVVMWLFSGLLWLLACGQWGLSYKALLHHARMLTVYTNWLPELICHNLCREPCHPFYVHEKDVSVTRPKPPPPMKGERSGDCDCCNCDCCNCDCCNECCILFSNMANRFIKASLFSYGHFHSCHPATCCGPLCPIETMSERIDRWEDEMAEDKAERTAKFYRKYEATGGVAMRPPIAHSMDSSDDSWDNRDTSDYSSDSDFSSEV